MSYRDHIDLNDHRDGLLRLLQTVIDQPGLSGVALDKLARKTARQYGRLFSRDEMIRAYRTFVESGDLPPFDSSVLERLRLKPVRTSSGVTPVTVLTKPFPCPGECIFCPNDVRMPKSYLSDEPGAQRAEQNSFDPYLQTYSRLKAYRNIGHPTDKIEIIILGGTWSFYPETYQLWFIKRIFDALHDFGAGIDRMVEVAEVLKTASQLHPERNTVNVSLHGEDLAQTYNQAVQSVYQAEMVRSRQFALAVADDPATRTDVDEYATWEEIEAAHQQNESADRRCVGLVIETRPDHISPEEVIRIRRLGCTKVQIGFQSLNDDVLRLNRRGHTVQQTREAVRLLRQMGFKIHAHWMPNLYGSSPDADVTDFQRMFDDPDFRPDELKVYPCSLIASAELMRYYQRGQWRPYSEPELLDVLSACFLAAPEYCRLTRVIRDIPGTDIVDGNRKTNFRQIVEDTLAKRGERSSDIRAREVRHRTVEAGAMMLDTLRYETSAGSEIFLQFIGPDRSIAGFLRLSLPDRSLAPLVDELADAAIIREVHVYGQAVDIGDAQPGRAQHTGLGIALIAEAERIAAAHAYGQLAVISAVGTRAYYRKRGFSDGKLYQYKLLKSAQA